MRTFNAPVNRVIRRNISHSPIAPLERHLYYNPQIEEPVKPKRVKKPKGMLCLLIAAHNEELVLAKTINSAIAAGMSPEDIYVVDDNSTDRTTEIARSIVPEQNAIKVRRSGKGLALTKGAKKFR